RIGHANCRLLGARGDLLGGEPGRPGSDAADLHDVAEDPDVERGEQALGETAHCHAGRGLTRARSLEHVPDVVVVVLEGAGKVAVPAGTTLGVRKTSSSSW